MSDTSSKISSVANTMAMLERLIAVPKVHTVVTIDNLKTQAALASLDLPELGIHPMSLNTLKHYVKESVPGGWEVFDELRKKAIRVLSKLSEPTSKPSRGSKQDILNRLQRSESEVQHYINEIARFAEQHTKLVEICWMEAKDNGDFALSFKAYLKKYASRKGNLAIVVGVKSG